MRVYRTLLLFCLLILLTGCPADAGDAERLIVFNAGSLAGPMRMALDSFAAATGVAVEQESAGSLEAARKLTELGKIPDVIALADEEVFPALLVPAHASWYARFARNRMVLAYTDESAYADQIGPDNWHRILQRRGVETGRADPNLDPNGYRTLLVLQLAEQYYREPGLAERLLARMPERNMRPKEADLVALLQAGELDYIWSYESMPRAAGLQFVQLPPAIDLGSPDRAERYQSAVVRVRGAGEGDTLVIRGRPIVYGFSIPREAPHPAAAARFAAYLLSGDGKRVLRASGLDALPDPELIGTGAPAEVTAAAARP